MHKISIIALLFICSNLSAKETLDLNKVDSISYKYFMDKNWKELIRFGDLAVKQGVDYYYLRMRIGIAHYEQGKYYSALPHFMKARAFNASDEVLQEYIFYCYEFTGQRDEALKFSRSFSRELADKLLKDKQPALEVISIESGIKKTNYSNQGDMLYSNVGLGHRVGKLGSLYHAFTYLNQDKIYDNYYYNKLYTDYSYKTELKLNTVQAQYYIAANLPIGNTWSIAPAFDFVNLSIQSDTSKYWMYKNGTPTKYNGTNSSQSTNYFLGSLSVKKTFANFEVAALTSVSNFDNKYQVQNGLRCSFFPFGNNKLICAATGYLQTEDGYTTLKPASSQSVAYSFGPKLWVSVSTLFNTAKNINEANGLLLNNSYDLTYKRGSCIVNYSVFKHVDIYAVYQREYKIESTLNKLYKFNTVIFGLKYKF
jgi:hypothetical protein